MAEAEAGQPVDIPDKLYFRIGEVARIAGVKPYVLRFWEGEFRAIRPEKSRTGQRLYRRRHVDAVLLVKRLLWQEGFTIPGARRRLRELGAEEPAAGAGPDGEAPAPAQPSPAVAALGASPAVTPPAGAPRALAAAPPGALGAATIARLRDELLELLALVDESP